MKKIDRYPGFKLAVMDFAQAFLFLGGIALAGFVGGCAGSVPALLGGIAMAVAGMAIYVKMVSIELELEKRDLENR